VTKCESYGEQSRTSVHRQARRAPDQWEPFTDCEERRDDPAPHKLGPKRLLVEAERRIRLRELIG